ncbi:MAG: glycosyltransferase family 4 protein, partial [Pyrinomonadaceae bacterium]|nr:glycosyltransferase family 4 protein [Pyrinomonadaceae bacterium]
VLYEEGHVAAKTAGIARAIIKRFRDILNASKFDIVYLFRTANLAGPAFLERLVTIRKIPMIFDFDDAIYMTNTSDANRKFGWLKFAEKTADICRISTSVSVGNSHLADYAKQFNENVFVIPTSIDTDNYQSDGHANGENERVVVGWTGSSTSQYHLEAFEPTLVELLERRDDVEIRVISNREPSFRQIPYTWREWSPESEVAEISEIEIGIMPTPDDEWSRGKCALKALQYMSLGIPAICTDMGANRDAIKHGENGYLAKTQDQWLEYFDRLIDDKTLRKKMGSEAKRTVLDGYSMKKCAELFAEAVRRTIAIGSRGNETRNKQE